MNLRPLRQRDLEPLFEIFRDVVADGTSYAQDERTPLEAFIEYWTDRGGEQWIAEDDDARLVGGYTLRPNHPGRGSHVGTASYLVASHARGRGVGRLLGAHSIERAPRLGFLALQFNFVVSTNAAAVKLWHSLGFTTVGTLPRAFRHPALGLVDAHVMYRPL
jgi:L-amino acid N-acyltransferase YncA